MKPLFTLLLACCAACGGSDPAPRAVAPVGPDAGAPVGEQAARTVLEAVQPAAAAQTRESTTPADLVEFGLQERPPAIEDLRAKARREIDARNADAELAKLQEELGVKQP